MREVSLPSSFEEFREQARALLGNRIAPSEILWSETQSSLNFYYDTKPLVKSEAGLKISKQTLRWMQNVSLHIKSEKWGLLYSLLWRMRYESPNILKNPADPEVIQAERMVKQVRRDIHKMHAFVRFKLLESEEEERFISLYKPDHLIVRAGTKFFAERFKQMRWSILTPFECAHWDGKNLSFSPGIDLKEEETPDDGIEDWWRTYYGSIFNPARVKVKMMKREMPVRFWKLLPEADIISDLLSEAPKREELMKTRIAIEASPPLNASLPALKEALSGCAACPIATCGGKAVFGEGEISPIMLVGEQPGDEEDIAGRPFVGPAGRLLNQLLSESGVDRKSLYVTNAVKHFKFELRGKRRIHKKPDGAEILACRPWLQSEIEAVDPDIIVCLGESAAQSVLGRKVKVGDNESQINLLKIKGKERKVFVTYHPAAILRAPEIAAKEKMISAIKNVFAVLERSNRHGFVEPVGLISID